ncbi:radical SAM protein [Peptoniphilus asaccharolyticus]
MDKFIELIGEKNKNQHLYRLGKTFRTKNKFFFLDTGTGKVFEINLNQYKILSYLLKTNSIKDFNEFVLPNQELKRDIDELYNNILRHNLLSAPIVSKENISDISGKLENILSENMSSLTLELTEECNLRCKYCIYGNTNSKYRSFGNKKMTFETAKKSIDYLMEHSNSTKEVYIGFYGGEPLIMFDLIKDIITYIEINYMERNIRYSMTTNGTLLTPEIAEYISNKENFSVVFSLDGPEYIHNDNRIFINGEGTFNATMQGIENYVLKKIENNLNPFFMISSVITPPYTSERIKLIDDFFKELHKKYNFDLLSSYVSKTTISEKYVNINDREETKTSDEDCWIYDPLMVWTLKNIDNDPYMKRVLIKNALIQIHKRNISDNVIGEYYLNGCCTPGGRRLYVTAEGNYLPCERIGNTPIIGNVNDGINFDVIEKKYIKDFIDEEIKYCGECWAINICNNCYIDCFGEEGIDFSHRHKLCSNTRGIIAENLSIYHELLDTHPNMLDSLNNITIN